MVRYVVLLTALAACSFQAGSSPSAPMDGPVGIVIGTGSGSGSGSGSGNGSGSDGGTGSGIDAAQPGLWTCGPVPGALPSTVSNMPTGADLEMSSIDATGGESGAYVSGQLVVASPGASLQLSLDFTLTDSRCAECRDQLEVGWMQGSAGPRSGCAWDDYVPNPDGVSDSVDSFTITAPSTPGAYDLRTNIGQDDYCGDHGSSWWDNEVPAPNTTIARLCVQ